MIPAQIGEPPVVEEIASRSPLAQLLHALNQPLTGLQCSMEVALAGSRTPEQYRQGLRDGLALTERMRALVEAIREVADGLDTDRLDKDYLDEDRQNEARNESPNEMTDLATILRETVNDLKPVAESKTIRMEIEFDSSLILVVRAGRQKLGSIAFRLLDSVLSLAADDSAVKISTVKIEAGSAQSGDWLRIQWEAEENIEARHPADSRPKLGLLVAQAGFECCGAKWQRLCDGKQETISIRLPGISRKNS